MLIKLTKRWRGSVRIPVITKCIDVLNINPTKQRKKRQSNTEFSEKDRKLSPFWRTYIEPVFDGEYIDYDHPIFDDTSKLGKKFRRRFRVPYKAYLDILHDLMKVHNFTTYTRKFMFNRETVDLRLLVLSSLRFLGSGCCFDLMEELTHVSEDTMRNFFHEKFTTWAVEARKEVIVFPDDVAGLSKLLHQYKKQYLPGCVGSIDCVHVVWDKCPASIRSQCKGKGDHPTLVFQVVCSHQRQILHVSRCFWGATNDKTIARFDPILHKLREAGTIYSRFRWHSLNSDGTLTFEHNGVYFISDGGYHRWMILIPPFKDQVPGTKTEKWSSLMESIRKDIECVFGILKKRFLFLKHAIRFHAFEQIERAFVACCVIHNILLGYDVKDDNAYDQFIKEDDVIVDHTLLEMIEIEKDAKRSTRRRNRVKAGLRSQNRDSYGIVEEDESDLWYEADDLSTLAPDRHIDNPFDEMEVNQFNARRQYLIQHYFGMRQRLKSQKKSGRRKRQRRTV